MELVNLHTHTGLSGHGEGSVAALASAASQAGLTTFAITEHYPLSEVFDPQAYLAMPEGKLDEYCAAVRLAQQEYPQMDILLGCEIDWLGALEDRDFAAADLSAFDHILGSVHFIDGWAFDDPAQRGRWEEEGADAIWKRYFETWCEAVSSDAPFTCMAHPDLAKKFGYYPSFDITPLYKQAVEAVKASGRMIEVNTSGLYYACEEMFPAQALLEEFCRAGVPCTIGTDAHTAAHIDRGLQEGYKWMYESGYREVAVPLQGGGFRFVTIE